MEDKLIIAVGNRPILYDQSLYTYRDTNRTKHSPCYDGIHLAIQKSNNKMQEEHGFVVVSGKRFDWLLAAPGSVGKFHAPIRQTHLPASVDGRMQWASGVAVPKTQRDLLPCRPRHPPLPQLLLLLLLLLHLLGLPVPPPPCGRPGSGPGAAAGWGRAADTGSSQMPSRRG